MLRVTLKEPPHIPLEAEVLSPAVLAGLSHDECCSQPVYLGKRKCRLDELFEVEGEDGEELEIHGDTGQVKWIGKYMDRGRITVYGNVNMHLGAYMKRGQIEVQGNAGDWVGAEMTGGQIHIRGNAGGQIGAAYRGSMSGMRDGTIVVEGRAGIEIGMRMRRGTIVVKGKVTDFAGLQMKGGTLFLLGGAEIRTGAWMTRGTIVSLEPLSLLPTFAYACSYDPTFLRLYRPHLAAFGVELPGGAGAFRRYTGDGSVPGKGEILCWQAA